MAKPKLRKPQHAQFVRLYLGRDPKLHGNATRCYMAVYGDKPLRIAQSAGSRLLQRDDIQAAIAHAESVALERAELDATYVLQQSKRLLDRAMGDEPIDETSVEIDQETGRERVTFRERRDYDPATARAALQLIGQHKDIQAFSQQIEVSHTHHLEQRLASRAKVIEGRAQRLTDPANQLPHLDSQAVTSDTSGLNANEHTSEVAPSDTHQHAHKGQKRVHPRGGQTNARANQDRSAPEREGATAA